MGSGTNMMRGVIPRAVEHILARVGELQVGTESHTRPRPRSRSRSRTAAALPLSFSLSTGLVILFSMYYK